MSSDGKTSSRSLEAATSTSTFLSRMVLSVALMNLFVFGLVGLSLYQSHEEFSERA